MSNIAYFSVGKDPQRLPVPTSLPLDHLKGNAMAMWALVKECWERRYPGGSVAPISTLALYPSQTGDAIASYTITPHQHGRVEVLPAEVAGDASGPALLAAHLVNERGFQIGEATHSLARMLGAVSAMTESDLRVEARADGSDTSVVLSLVATAPGSSQDDVLATADAGGGGGICTTPSMLAKHFPGMSLSDDLVARVMQSVSGPMVTVLRWNDHVEIAALVRRDDMHGVQIDFGHLEDPEELEAGSTHSTTPTLG